MLEGRALQSLVPDLACGGKGQVVAGIGLVVAARRPRGCWHTGPGRRRLRVGCPAVRRIPRAFSATARASSCWPASLRALARSPIVAERFPSSVAALAWSGVDSSVSQGWPPAFSTSASQSPMDSRRTGIACVGAPHWLRTLPNSPIASCQLKRGIELRGLAEALDEGLKLLHCALRIALGKPRVGVLPFVVSGFLREALLGHRVLQPLHPGIAFAEAAGPFQIIAKRLAQRPRRPGTADRPRPSGRRCGSSPPRGPGFPARCAIGSPSVPCPAPA